MARRSGSKCRRVPAVTASTSPQLHQLILPCEGCTLGHVSRPGPDPPADISHASIVKASRCRPPPRRLIHTPLLLLKTHHPDPRSTTSTPSIFTCILRTSMSFHTAHLVRRLWRFPTCCFMANHIRVIWRNRKVVDFRRTGQNVSNVNFNPQAPQT